LIISSYCGVKDSSIDLCYTFRLRLVPRQC